MICLILVIFNVVSRSIYRHCCLSCVFLFLKNWDLLAYMPHGLFWSFLCFLSLILTKTSSTSPSPPWLSWWSSSSSCVSDVYISILWTGARCWIIKSGSAPLRWHFLSAPLTLLNAQHCTPNKDTNTHSYICMYTNTDTDTIFPKIKNVWGFCFSVQKGSLHIYTKSYCSQKILVNMYLTKENSWNMSFKSRQIKFCSKVEMSGTSLIMVSIILNYILHKVSREIFNSCVPNGVILE